MSTTAFEAFAEAVTTRSTGADIAPAPRFDRIAVLGGGSDARLIAALCLAEGAEVTLFSAYGAELETLRNGRGVSLRGDGPVGNYQVDQAGAPSIATTAELDRAVSDAQVIFLTGPVHKQRTYAMVLADHLRDGQVLVLAPGRSLGAAETAWLLRVGGATADITLVEIQGLPYWCETAGNTLTLFAAAPMAAATLPGGRDAVLTGLSRFLPNLAPVISTVHGSFADGSGLVEVPALLMGGPAVGDGAIAVPEGAVPLLENRNFRAMIGPGHASVMARMAEERHAVAARFGVRDLPDLSGWLDTFAGALKGPGRRPVPSSDAAAHIVRCATIGSLVPLASAARMAGQPAPVTEAMIALAGSVLGADLTSAGRKLEAIGIEAGTIEDARRIMDDIAKGAR